MAGRGPAPKDRTLRVRPGKDVPATTAIADDGLLRGPDLPDGMTWPEQTRRWWNTWRTSPQAQTMTTTDWDFLLDTAVLHAQFWTGFTSVAAELRLRVAKFGATPEDRARLRIQVSDPEQKPAEKPGNRYGHLRSVTSA